MKKGNSNRQDICIEMFWENGLKTNTTVELRIIIIVKPNFLKKLMQYRVAALTDQQYYYSRGLCLTPRKIMSKIMSLSLYSITPKPNSIM